MFPSPRLALTGGVDFANAYYFRGYLQAKNGLVVQPYVNFFVPIHTESGFVIRPYASLFYSGHEGGDVRMSDMSDAMLGAVTTWRGLTVDARYAFYSTCPTMRAPLHELGARLSVDLTSAWSEPDAPSALSVRPFAGLYADFMDCAENNSVYAEAGIEPSYRFDVAGHTVGIGLPLTLGLSPRDYYFNSSGSNAPLGYVSAGLTASIALPAPFGKGQWFLNTSVQYQRLTADNVIQLNDGERNVVVGKIGVGFVF